MNEPWNLKKEDLREANTLPTFIIFCEDGEIEPEYFNSFKSGKIIISTITNCGKQHRQVDFATDYCRKNDLLEIFNGKELLKLDEGAQVWCVFDRDKENNDGKDTSFTDSIDTAVSKGIKTAWSNDNFELWILLHFEDVEPSDITYSAREIYYERLTEILRTITPLNEDEEKVTRNANFHYKETMKRKKRFIGITYQHMKGKTEIALERAGILETFHSNPPKPHHLKSPCTMVHHLVQELVRLR